eukprot:jgi/Psemu1/37351/gm1.37351_g
MPANTINETYYQVGGLTFSVNPDQPTVNQPTQIGSYKENELIKAITAKQGELFKVVNSSLKASSRLKINLSIRQKLNHTEAIWKSADLLNPCHIIYPIDDSTNLVRLKVNSDVAASVNDQEETFSCELEWSYSYFRNNTELRLRYKTVQKNFATYEPQEQGGPLFLKLLLDHPIISNDTSKAALVDTIKNCNIQQNLDEDIPKVTKLLSLITDMIVATSIQDHKEHELPDNYIQSLVKVYQTTSMDQFKPSQSSKMTSPTVDNFAPLPKSNFMGSISAMENTPAYCDLVFAMDVATYRDLWATNNPHNKCWNCGKEGCDATICPKPKDQNEYGRYIKADNEEFYYFVTRILSAVNPVGTNFKQRKATELISDIFSVTDEAFALMIIDNEFGNWEKQKKRKLDATDVTQTKKKYMRKKYCDLKSGSADGWDKTGQIVFARLCKKVKTLREDRKTDSSKKTATVSKYGGPVASSLADKEIDDDNCINPILLQLLGGMEEV